MAEIKQVFTARRLVLTDGSVVCEVITPDGERIASCTNELMMRTLALSLNSNLTAWQASNPTNHVLSV